MARTQYLSEMSLSHYYPEGKTSAGSTQYIMPFVRSNRHYRDRKKMTVYVNDSSYSNPSDPNSMTDQGQIRNAPYAIDTDPFLLAEKEKLAMS
jgi:hypothetical protein